MYLRSTSTGGRTDGPIHVLPSEFWRPGNVLIGNGVLVTHTRIRRSEQELRTKNVSVIQRQFSRMSNRVKSRQERKKERKKDKKTHQETEVLQRWPWNMDFFQLAFTSIINERESGSIFTRLLNRPANKAQYLKD